MDGGVGQTVGRGAAFGAVRCGGRCSVVRWVMQRGAMADAACCDEAGRACRGKKGHDAVLIGGFFVLLRTKMNFATGRAGADGAHRCCPCCTITDKCIHPYSICRAPRVAVCAERALWRCSFCLPCRHKPVTEVCQAMTRRVGVLRTPLVTVCVYRRRPARPHLAACACGGRPMSSRQTAALRPIPCWQAPWKVTALCLSFRPIPCRRVWCWPMWW